MPMMCSNSAGPENAFDGHLTNGVNTGALTQVPTWPALVNYVYLQVRSKIRVAWQDLIAWICSSDDRQFLSRPLPLCCSEALSALWACCEGDFPLASSKQLLFPYFFAMWCAR